MGAGPGRSTQSLAVMNESVSAREAVKGWDLWELLGTPYLDTSHDTEWSIAFSEELRARGIVGLGGLKYRVLALAGFWWNFLLWWEWAYLGRQHLIWGWVLNGVHRRRGCGEFHPLGGRCRGVLRASVACLAVCSGADHS